MSRAFWQRLVIFVTLFVAVSGVTGSWLISTNKLLFPFYFSIYGSAGKVFLFSITSFVILTKDQLPKIELEPLGKSNAGWWGMALAAVGGFFWSANQLLQFQHFSDAPFLAVVAHLLLIMAGIGVLLGAFGVKYIRQVARTCGQALVMSLVMAIAFYGSFHFIFRLWPYLSAVVLWAVMQLLRITQPEAMVVAPLTIHLPQFAVTIGEYCSGIESLFLITALYILIGCVERERVRPLCFILGYFPLIIGMFIVNIVRVYGIIQAGVLMSPEIAAKLFHTYLGMILFMVYFILFWKFTSHFLLIPKPNLGKRKI